MNFNIIYIKDSNTNKFFAFIKEMPMICSESYTKYKCTQKVISYYNSFIEKKLS